MNEKNFPILAATLVILTAVLIMVAIVVPGRFFKIHPADNEAAVFSAGTSTAGTSTESEAASTSAADQVSVTSVQASQSIPKAPASTPTSQASPAKAIPQTSVANEARGEACTANGLTGSASWERTGTYVTGALRIQNRTNEDCVFSRSSNLEVYSGTALLANRVIARPSEGLVIPAQGERIISFTWSNWCGASLRNPAYVRLILPGADGYLRVPLISERGMPQYDNPRCDFPGQATEISMWW
jgi:hypothetical protein